MSRKSCLLLAPFMAISLFSCTSPQPPSSVPQKHTYGIITLDQDVPYSIMAWSKKFDQYHDTGTGKYDTAFSPTYVDAQCYFGGGSGWSSAGIVELNGVAFPMDSNVYTLFEAPLTLDGSYQRWSVAGSSVVPAITDSLQGPTESVSISSPTVANDIIEDSGLTVSWNSTTNASETSILTVIPKSDGYSFDVELPGTTSSYTIPASTLNLIPKGRATVLVQRGVYKLGTAPDSKSYIMVFWAEDAVDVNLK